MKRVVFFRNLPLQRQPLMEVLVCDREQCVQRIISFDEAVQVKNNEIMLENLSMYGYKECLFYEKINKLFWRYRLQRGKAPYILTLETLPNCDLSCLTYIDRRCAMWVAHMQTALAKELRESMKHILASNRDYRPKMVDFRKVTAAKRIYRELFKGYVAAFGLGEDKIDVFQVPSHF